MLFALTSLAKVEKWKLVATDQPQLRGSLPMDKVITEEKKAKVCRGTTA